MLARPRSYSFGSKRAGTVTAMTAVLLPVTIGVMALTLDGGMLFLMRRQAQSTADAASLAGAYALYTGSNFSTAQSYAVTIAGKNGITITSANVTEPQTGEVSVSATATQPKCFSAIWGSGNMSATASAVSSGGANTYTPAAILVLASTGSSVMLSGTTQITASNGSVIVDSTSSSAILSSGSCSITTPTLDLCGNITYSGTSPNKATVTNYSQPNTPDPLASIPAPSSSGMTVQSSSAIALSGSTSRTLSPGVYTGGIVMSGSSSITLSAGMYYINGGGISMSGSSSITGSGVFIYNTGGGAISMSGTGTISLSPMTSGTYAGITIFQDRSNTAGAALSGGSNLSNTGTFYFPSATVALSGSSSVGVVGSQLIVNELTFSGSGGVSVSYNASSVARKSSLAIVQ
jgi:Flp pilus assembly protein TadG